MSSIYCISPIRSVIAPLHHHMVSSMVCAKWSPYQLPVFLLNENEISAFWHFWHCQSKFVSILWTSKSFIELNKRHITLAARSLDNLTINNIGHTTIQLIVLIDRFKCKFYNLWSYVCLARSISIEVGSVCWLVFHFWTVCVCVRVRDFIAVVVVPVPSSTSLSLFFVFLLLLFFPFLSCHSLLFQKIASSSMDEC